MSGVNLFEQQAVVLSRVRHGNVTPVSSDEALRDLLGLIDTASLSMCKQLSETLGKRLRAYEKCSTGMRASNLDEAARMHEDAALDIQGAIELANEEEQDSLHAHREAAGRVA